MFDDRDHRCFGAANARIRRKYFTAENGHLPDIPLPLRDIFPEIDADANGFVLYWIEKSGNALNKYVFTTRDIFAVASNYIEWRIQYSEIANWEIGRPFGVGKNSPILIGTFTGRNIAIEDLNTNLLNIISVILFYGLFNSGGN